MSTPTTPMQWIEYLRECDDEEAMQIAKGWENDPQRFRSNWIGRGFDAADVDALVAECRRLREKVGTLPSVSLMRWAQYAQVAPGEPIGDQDADEPPGVTPPSWKTGVTRLDHLIGGGAYGMTVIAAQPKCGKSMLALSCAVNAGLEGWRVLYLNGELTRSEMANRIRRYCRDQVPMELVDAMSIHPVELGITIPHVIDKVRERIQISDSKILVVVDSINRIVDMSQADSSEHGYWSTMRMWQEWLRRCSQVSEGRLASVVVSELNAGGHIKGRSLEYASDLCIRINPAKDLGAGVFEIDVPYARSSAGGGVGTYRLNWREGRFEYAGGD